MPPCGLLTLLTAPAALAQDATVAPDAPVMPPVAFAESRVWERRGRMGADSPVAGVAVQPGPGGAWIAVDESGAVWRSEDEGNTWDRVLRGEDEDEGLPDDERLLLEAESRQEEALEDAGVEDETTIEETPDGEVEVPSDVEADVSEAAEAAIALLDDSAADKGPAPLPLTWFDTAAPDRVFVARPDGLWRSDDAGQTWEDVHVSETGDPGITLMVRSPDGALVLGTDDGVWFSLDDGASWIDVAGATDGGRVNSIEIDAGLLWAATDAGLFNSPDALHWDRVALPTRDEVRVVVADAAWDRGFWIATRSALYRTDDGGGSFYQAGRQPLHGLRRMVQLDEPGHLLATSEDGVWESVDGGVAWSTADRQLTEPDVRALAFAEGTPVIATPHGVWRLVPPRESTGPVARVRTLPLGDTIEAAVTRRGLDLDLLSLSRLGVVAKFAPTLELDFDYGTTAGRTNSYVSYTTKDDHDNDWSANARLCWGNCSSTLVVSYSDDLDLSDSDNLYVFDGKVYDDGAPVAAAANVAQSIRSYRRSLADSVADAWLSRSHLVEESASVRSLPLRDQVLHALQIQELDARLDALTDGAFGRAVPPDSSPRSEESP